MIFDYIVLLLLILTMAYLATHRWLATVSVFMLFIVNLLYMTHQDIIGRPKPMRTALSQEQVATVISAVMREDEAIYIWIGENDAPRSYSLPWSDEAARQLHKAQREAEANGSTVKMDVSKERAAGQPLFYSAPVEPLPPKNID